MMIIQLILIDFAQSVQQTLQEQMQEFNRYCLAPYHNSIYGDVKDLDLSRMKILLVRSQLEAIINRTEGWLQMNGVSSPGEGMSE